MMPALFMMLAAVKLRFCAYMAPWLLMFVAEIARLPALLMVPAAVFRKLLTLLKLKLKFEIVFVMLREFRTETGMFEEMRELFVKLAPPRFRTPVWMFAFVERRYIVPLLSTGPPTLSVLVPPLTVVLRELLPKSITNTLPLLTFNPFVGAVFKTVLEVALLVGVGAGVVVPSAIAIKGDVNEETKSDQAVRVDASLIGRMFEMKDFFISVFLSQLSSDNASAVSPGGRMLARIRC